MRWAAPDYLRQLQALLPTGAAWPRDSEATLTRTLAGLAEELARVDARGGDLITETDPRDADELLAEWERAYGLPDTCTASADTIEGRRLALHQKVVSFGGQNPAYFVSMAALLGYEAEVVEFRPLRIPFRIPAVLAGRAWAFAWRMDVYGPIGGDLVSPVPPESLECVIRRARPAHTVVSFDYPGSESPSLYFSFI